MHRWVIRSIVAVVGASALFAAYIGLEIYSGNMHEVRAGELYRSAQPSAQDIARYQRNYGIKSIINLRGGNPNDQWYQEEIAASAASGIKHYDFRMKGSRELTDEQALALIDLMRNAPKPVLIHCHSGADRTGLAAAMYLAAISKQSEWTAERQMWLMYGHIPYSMGAAVAMNRTFERMEPRFGFGDNT